MISLANMKRYNIVDPDISKLYNIGIQEDREHLRSCLVLHDKLSKVDNFENKN
jgi:uncharacterized protein YqgQ